MGPKSTACNEARSARQRPDDGKPVAREGHDSAPLVRNGCAGQFGPVSMQKPQEAPVDLLIDDGVVGFTDLEVGCGPAATADHDRAIVQLAHAGVAVLDVHGGVGDAAYRFGGEGLMAHGVELVGGPGSDVGPARHDHQVAPDFGTVRQVHRRIKAVFANVHDPATGANCQAL